MYDKTFDYVTKNHVHLKALGIHKVWMNTHEPIRWDLVTRVETGGSYRHGFSTSQYIIGKHPSGIELSWQIELEPRSENGTGVLKLDTKTIKEVIDNAPPQASASVRQWLNDAISEISKHIDDLEKGLKTCKMAKSLFEESLSD